MDLFIMENGKMAQHWGQPDLMTMMQQLGVAPMPDQ
jgi:predicted ester cyclase